MDTPNGFSCNSKCAFQKTRPPSIPDVASHSRAGLNGSSDATQSQTSAFQASPSLGGCPKSVCPYIANRNRLNDCTWWLLCKEFYASEGACQYYCPTRDNTTRHSATQNWLGTAPLPPPRPWPSVSEAGRVSEVIIWSSSSCEVIALPHDSYLIFFQFRFFTVPVAWMQSYGKVSRRDQQLLYGDIIHVRFKSPMWGVQLNGF